MKEGQTQEPVGGMKWENCANRMPDKEGEFVMKYIPQNDGQVRSAFLNSTWLSLHGKICWNNIPSEHYYKYEWLDENYTPPPSPVGIDVDELVKALKWAIAELDALNERTYQDVGIETQLEFAKEALAGYSTSLLSSSVTGEEEVIGEDPFIKKHLAIIREKTIEGLVHTHIEAMGELEKASVKHFLETGKVNGSFMERIKRMMIAFVKNWNKSAETL